MALHKTSLVLSMVVAAILWTGSTAQTDCTNTLISLSPCLSFISGNASKPDSGCCPQLSSVVKSKPECLCQVLNGGGSTLGVQVNQTQAQALPAACNVQTPPPSSCNGGTPTKGTPSGPGSNSTPSKDNGTSDGSSSSTKLVAPLLFSLLFVASYASAFNI